MAIFEGEKLTTDVINNDTMSEDEVIASYVTPAELVHFEIAMYFSAISTLIGHTLILLSFQQSLLVFPLSHFPPVIPATVPIIRLSADSKRP